jgi:hypothetical protein
MLYAFGFDRIGIVASDIYFVDPHPGPGQEGAERGVRLELRVFERPDLRGSLYSAQPIAVERPIWRVDLLESVAHPGSLDRAHHHPRFSGWEPGNRVFVEELSADPVPWLAKRLQDFESVLDQAGIGRSDVGPDDVEDVRRAAPEILDAVQRLLDGVQAGTLARPPDGGTPEQARRSWL